MKGFEEFFQNMLVFWTIYFLSLVPTELPKKMKKIIKNGRSAKIFDRHEMIRNTIF